MLPSKEELAKLPPETLLKMWALVREYIAKLAVDGVGCMPASAVQALAEAVPDQLVKDIVADNRRGVPEPSGLLGPSTGGSPTVKGSGWQKPTPLEPPSGVRYVDQIADHFAALDKAEAIADAIDKVKRIK